MYKYRSFTLIEMIIVIVIISAMLLIALGISSDQTKALRFKIARENFIANYNAFIIKAITTNSSDLELIFRDNKNNNNPPIVMSGAGANSVYFEDMSQLQTSTFNNSASESSFEDYTLSFDPVAGGCVLTDSLSNKLSNISIPFSLKYRADSTVAKICYDISLSTCKLRQIGCPST